MQKMIFAFLVAAAIAIVISPWFIKMLRRLKYGQVERAEGPHAHSAKEGTPTMGGIMFIIGIVKFCLNADERKKKKALKKAKKAQKNAAKNQDQNGQNQNGQNQNDQNQ